MEETSLGEWLINHDANGENVLLNISPMIAFFQKSNGERLAFAINENIKSVKSNPPNCTSFKIKINETGKPTTSPFLETNIISFSYL